MPEHLEPDNEHYLNYPLQTYTNAYLHPDAMMSEQEKTIQSHALEYTDTDRRHHNTRAIQRPPRLRRKEGRF